MTEKDTNKNTAEIFLNEYGETVDPTVVVDEQDRTVLLTEQETIIIEKEPRIDVVPKNRPRKVYGGMWGQAEIATVGLGLLAILTVLLIYIFVVMPSNRELERNLADRDRLEKELTSANEKYGNISDTQTRVNELLKSVNDFELSYLPVAANGRTTLYQRINGLIAAYGLINTTGPDYAPLETADRGAETDEERGRAKFRSLFPGVYITTTVEGSYHNLRRFIREIETGREFVVISAVELEPSDTQQKPDTSGQQPQPVVNQEFPGMAVDPNQPFPVGQPPRRQRGKTHGETVSLRLEMAAYFRRPNFVPLEF